MKFNSQILIDAKFTKCNLQKISTEYSKSKYFSAHDSSLFKIAIKLTLHNLIRNCFTPLEDRNPDFELATDYKPVTQWEESHLEL